METNDEFARRMRKRRGDPEPVFPPVPGDIVCTMPDGNPIIVSDGDQHISLSLLDEALRGVRTAGYEPKHFEMHPADLIRLEADVHPSVSTAVFSRRGRLFMGIPIKADKAIPQGTVSLAWGKP